MLTSESDRWSAAEGKASFGMVSTALGAPVPPRTGCRRTPDPSRRCRRRQQCPPARSPRATDRGTRPSVPAPARGAQHVPSNLRSIHHLVSIINQCLIPQALKFSERAPQPREDKTSGYLPNSGGNGILPPASGGSAAQRALPCGRPLGPHKPGRKRKRCSSPGVRSAFESLRAASTSWRPRLGTERPMVDGGRLDQRAAPGRQPGRLPDGDLLAPNNR